VEAEIDELEGDVDDLKKKINKQLADCRRAKQSQKESNRDYLKAL